MVVAQLSADARIHIETRHGHWPSGAGTRGLRHWLALSPCCTAADLAVHADGRRGCRSCGEWASASHSDGVLGLARSEHPVGIDVQLPRRRAAALRVLAAASGVPSPGIAHWALAEATLKALGQARRRPSRLPFPSELAGELRWEAESGEALAGYVIDLADRLDVPVGTMLAVVWVVGR